MKKFSLMVMALIVAATMSATVVTYDFSNPSSLGLTPSSKSGEGVSLGSDTITVGTVSMYFTVPSGSGAKLWTATGPKYTLRLYQPSSIVLTSSGDNIRGIRVTRSQGDITGLDENNEWRGDAKSVTFSVPSQGKANYITMVTVYVGEEMPTTKVDTISVSEARQRIDAKNLVACYIKGVVATAPTDPGSYGNTTFWMTDITTPTDSIYAFKITGKDGAKISKAEDIPFSLCDTIMIKADALLLYSDAKGTKYEATPGSYVETLGKTSIINANSIFKYGFGAMQRGMAYDGTRYKYELVLSEIEEEYDQALHMVLNSTKENGIVGTYTIKNFNTDSSFVDGKGPVAGSATVAFVKDEGTTHNLYSVKATFTCGGVLYALDTTYSLSGWTQNMVQFKLSDDLPYVPKEGDTITCAQALSYAKSLGTEPGVNVYVRGFVTGTQSISGRAQQSPYMADESTATKGIFQAYLCYTQNRDSVIKGDEIIVYGPVSYYAGTTMGQIQKGQIYRIGGSSTQRPVTTEEIPAGAITVAEAIALAAQLSDGDTTAQEYTIKGYVTKLYKTYNGQYSSQSFYMDDTPFQAGAFYTMEAFQSKIAVAAIVGDYVFVTGRITKYVQKDPSPARRETGDASYNIVNSVTKFAELSSGVEEISTIAKEAEINKIIMNGQFFIIKNGVIYNAQGAVIR